MQNNYICYSLKLNKAHHLSEDDFKLINWLPTSERVDQCINTITYNFVNNTCPYYLNEIFEIFEITFLNLKIHFTKQTWDKKQFIILVPLFGTVSLT